MGRPFSLQEDVTLPPISSPCPQLQELLEAASAVQKLGPGPQAQAVRQRQETLGQAWEALKLHVEQRRTRLERACLLARFHRAVRALSSWAACVYVRACMCVCVVMHVRVLLRPSSSGGKPSVDTS